MRHEWLAGLVLAFCLILPLGGCASAGGVEGAAGEGVAVQVNNTLIPPTALTIAVVTEGGQRQLLGTVEPSATASFTFNPTTLRSAEFLLVGEATAGSEIVSRPFSLVDVTAIEWDVNLNSIQVLEGS